MITYTYDHEKKLDEILAENCTVHLERIGEKDWCLAIYGENGTKSIVDFYGCDKVEVMTERPPEQRDGADASGQNGACPNCGWWAFIEVGDEPERCVRCGQPRSNRP